jgi:hypothetical protein
MDDRIEQLVNAGLKITLTQETLERLSKLTKEEVQALVKVCKKLTASGKSELVYSSWPSTQPPSSRAS